VVSCQHKNISAIEIISATSLKLFQSNRTCRKLCKCHLLSVRDSQLAPPIPWKNFTIFYSRWIGTTYWNEIISLQNCFTVKYFISTWNQNFMVKCWCWNGWLSYTDMTCFPPRTHNTFGDRSFSVAGPRVWNSSPADLRLEMQFRAFRRQLKTVLFSRQRPRRIVTFCFSCTL